MSTLEPTTGSAVAAARPRHRRKFDVAWWVVAPAADGLVLLFAVFVERLGSSTLVDPSGPNSAFFFFFPLIALGLLAGTGMYRPRLRLQLLDDLRTIAGATAIAAMATMTVSVIVQGQAHLAVHGVRLWLFSTVYLTASRGGVISSLVAARRAEGGARTLIVGAGSVGQLLARRLLDHPEVGLRPIGFLDKNPLEDRAPSKGRPLPVLGASWDLGSVIEEYAVEHVLLTFSTAPHDVLLRLVDECSRRKIRVTVVPRLFERMPRGVAIDYLGAIPLVSLYPSRPDSLPFKVKYALDRLVAATALVLMAPVFVAVALGVLVTAGRPIFFRQARIGYDGTVFWMLKFRSMRKPAAEEQLTVELDEDTAPGGVEGSDRRTMFGAFIRRLSLDELPQLVNVLRGDMSLVGPRPERPEFVELFMPRVKRYADRHRVRSGITGWAQIEGLRGKTSLSDRVEWDNWYIENWTLGLDLKILLHTPLAILRSRAE